MTSRSLGRDSVEAEPVGLAGHRDYDFRLRHRDRSSGRRLCIPWWLLLRWIPDPLPNLPPKGEGTGGLSPPPQGGGLKEGVLLFPTARTLPQPAFRCGPIRRPRRCSGGRRGRRSGSGHPDVVRVCLRQSAGSRCGTMRRCRSLDAGRSRTRSSSCSLLPISATRCARAAWVPPL